MKNKKLVRCLAIVFIISIVLTGCQKTEPVATSTEPVRDTVTFAINNEVSSLDPYSTTATSDHTMYQNVFESLIWESESGEITPNLAESWTISEDGKVYTFKLKKGVKFHNGEELKASDVVFTANRAMGSPYGQACGKLIEKAIAIDEYTVQLNIKRSYAPFLIALKSLYIQNEKAVNEAGENLSLNPIGTGPYKFVKYDLGQRVVFERFDDCHKGPAHIKNLVYKIIPDANTSLLAFESGEIDYLFEIPSIAYESIKSNDKFVTNKFESGLLIRLGLNLAKKPFDNLLVRKAMNHAIDKNAIIEMALEGLGKPAVKILSERYFGYSKNVTEYEYNPEKAKELLTEAGYPNGFKTSIRTSDGNKKIAEIVQEQLNKVGIEATIGLSDGTAFGQDLRKSNYEIGISGCELDRDADFWAYVYKTGDLINFSAYSSPRVDELFEKGQASVDRNERLKIYEELFQILTDDAVDVPLYYVVKTSASNAKLKIGSLNVVGGPHVFEMSWQE